MGKQLSSYLAQVASANFKTVVRESHRLTAKADIYFAGSYVTTMPIASGTITVDRTATNCRSGTIVVGDPRFSPTFLNSPLAPFGAELKIYSGLVYGSGITEWIPLGVFTIEDGDSEDSLDSAAVNGGLPEVQFYDRSRVVERAKFYYPHDRSGWDVRELIYHLITDVCPDGTQVIFDPSLPSGKNVPGGTVFTEDRWGAVTTCCGYLGAEGRFGWDGNFYVQPIPTLQGVSSPSSVWTFNAGPGGVLISAKRGVSRTGVYNFVAVTGKSNGSNPTPVGYAWDSDPNSPTYWGPTQESGEIDPSTFGSNVINLQNDLCTTAQECAAYAQAQLGQHLGLARSLDFSSVPNPALDAGDVVTVTYRNGVSEYHILDSFQVPLGLDQNSTMTGTGKQTGLKVGYTTITSQGFPSGGGNAPGTGILTTKPKNAPKNWKPTLSGMFFGSTRTSTYSTLG